VTPPVRRSPLSGAHRALGAAFDLEAGWEIVAGYTDELPLATSTVSVAEITPRAKVDVRGSTGALGVEDAFAAAIASDWTLVFGPPGAEERLLPAVASTGSGALITDATHLYAGFALIGPASDEALSQLTAFDAATLPPGGSAGTSFLDVPAVLVRRDLGLPVIEAYVGSEFAGFAWSEVLETVIGLGGGPAGWRALRNAGWR